MNKKRKSKSLAKADESVLSDRLLSDIRQLIERTRQGVAQTVNSALVVMNWHIGKMLREEIGAERADYGKQVIENLAEKLTADYGKGFTAANLFNFMHFSEVFPEQEILYALSRELSWTHFRRIIYIKDKLKRDFYAEMCRVERWSTRTLAQKIDSMLYERTALSKKPEKLIKQEIETLQAEDLLTPDLIFRDPYFLDFLGLADNYSERDLENAILKELEKFLLELGSDFAFVARQKRITIDDEDYYLDLLFYHRKLRRLVLIELKIGKLKAADIGQVELYLRWLNKYERHTGEESPIGLILCTEKGKQMVELLELEQRGVRIAEYLTELPPRELLEKRLLTAIELAQETIAKHSVKSNG